MKIKKENNYAFIDGQNLHLQTDFPIDFKRFRIYLKDKYDIVDAYYFLGFKKDEPKLYIGLQKAGFILVFNDKNENSESTKNGNVDTNLVFNVMWNLMELKFDKTLIVSGDGDYKQMIDYLIEKDRFKAILVPSNNVSSLYNGLKGGVMVRINKLQSKYRVFENEKTQIRTRPFNGFFR